MKRSALGDSGQARGLAGSPGERRREGAAQFCVGTGFFNPAARPARDLGVLLARTLSRRRPLRVLDLMAGCGLRALRYGLEAGVQSLVVNDADPDRLPLLQGNLSGLPESCLLRVHSESAHRLLASLLLSEDRFDLVDLDAFGSPQALVPLVLETVALEGVLYLASSDGRGQTGHDRRAGLRHLGASVRSHPSSWELALRLQLGAIARSAWCQGRGVEPVFSISDGRTFRTAVRLRRRASPAEASRLGLLATCHRCGEQQVQTMLQLRSWDPCRCDSPVFAISGPLWIGALQDPATLDAMVVEAGASSLSLCREGERLLARLRLDPGQPARSWPTALIARFLRSAQPPLQVLVDRLREEGFQASASGVMAGHLRSDAPWTTILSLAADLVGDPAR